MRSISQTFRCFDEVARRGSIRKAADVLHLTAAAVHQQIRNLEEQVGVPLFDRLPRGMQLTLAGEIVIAAVRRSPRVLQCNTTRLKCWKQHLSLVPTLESRGIALQHHETIEFQCNTMRL